MFSSGNYPVNLVRPIIEQLDQQSSPHQLLASKICNYLVAAEAHHTISRQLQQDYYESLQQLLQDPETQRILLYLPFTDLINAPETFRTIYLTAWYDLLNQVDVRESFHLGDTLEEDARREGRLEAVVKCIHLVPWLVRARYLSFADLEKLLIYGNDDILLLQNFCDIWPVLEAWELFSSREMKILRSLTAHAPPRKDFTPLYTSAKRQEWLDELVQTDYQLATPQANLAGPFSLNLLSHQKWLRELAQNLCSQQIVLINGSRLKGYGLAESDFDVIDSQKYSIDAHNLPGSNNHALLCLTSVWAGKLPRADLLFQQQQMLSQCCNSFSRQTILRRLEGGLIQYRLLQKGFQRFYHIKKFATARFSSIDGDCAFYNEHFRRIATEIFAKYVFLPPATQQNLYI